jgi:SAM-dependent methyltransferase
MNKDDKADLTGLTRLYEESLAKHGVKPLAVGWRDEESHTLRLQKLAEVIDRSTLPVSINDLGCGYGAFYEFLVHYDITVNHFRGYDISEQMLKQARTTVPDGEFIAGSLVDKPADYSVACGIFNVRLKENDATWLAHIEHTLDNMNHFSRRGFAFNLLTSYVEWKEPHLFYGDPAYFFDLCKRRFSRKVALLHDYPLWEWTMIVRK